SRLWTLLNGENPLAAILSTASERGDFLPAHWISTAYLAWQAAVIPRWDAASGRHVESFSPRAFLRGLLPARERAFHEIRPRGAGAPRPQDPGRRQHEQPDRAAGAPARDSSRLRQPVRRRDRAALDRPLQRHLPGLGAGDLGAARGAEPVALPGGRHGLPAV